MYQAVQSPNFSKVNNVFVHGCCNLKIRSQNRQEFDSPVCTYFQMEKIFSERALKWINEWSAMLFHMDANTFCLQCYTNVQYKYLFLYVQKSIKCFASSVCVWNASQMIDLKWSVMIKNSSRFFTFKAAFFLNWCCFFFIIFLRCFFKIAATFFVCLFNTGLLSNNIMWYGRK